MTERWHRTQSLVGLPGMPNGPRPIQLHGPRRGWVFRETQWGRRRVLEWLESSLPDETQAALRESRGAAVPGSGSGAGPLAQAEPTVPVSLPADGRAAVADAIPAVEAKIAAWLQTRREAQRRSLAAAGLDAHRDLTVTEQVMTALSHAQAVGDVVLVHGQSGAGKSWAAQHYCRTHSSAYYVSMTVAVRGLPGLLGRVGVAVGVGATHGSALDAESAIIARLQDRGALLTVDEAHHLTAKLLDELRCIRDVAGCGLALIGDNSVRMALARCPQIVGRIGVRVGIPLPSEADVSALVSGVLGRRASKREAKTALAVARGPGGMHALRRLLARAWLLAQADERERIEVEDLEISADEEIAA